MTGAPTKAQETKLAGLYMYGGVGVGKTMLMDLLAHHAPSAFQVRFSLLLNTVCKAQHGVSSACTRQALQLNGRSSHCLRGA